MTTRFASKLFAALAALAATAAQAQVAPPTHDLPEPSTWALMGLAAVVGIVASRKRRK